MKSQSQSFLPSKFLYKYMYCGLDINSAWCDMFQLHMFDVDLGAHMKITESELNQHGDSLTTVQTGINEPAHEIMELIT